MRKLRFRNVKLKLLVKMVTNTICYYINIEMLGLGRGKSVFNLTVKIQSIKYNSMSTRNEKGTRY